VVGNRTFHVGFCLGIETGFSAIGIAVIDRLMMEAPGAALHVVLVAHKDIAWDIVLRHLRSFTGQVLLFAFPDSDVCDAGTAEKYYSKAVQLFDDTGRQLERLTAIVQVDSPVGVNRRSSLDLTHRLAKDFDGVIHWARDTETFQSILNSFIRLDLESISPPELPPENCQALVL
jgi:hypothetical protein